MTISQNILARYPELDDGQIEFIGRTDGHLLGVAAPGSGKTRAISLLHANLILSRQAHANEILMCTFSREAAAEMRNRFARDAKALGLTDHHQQAHIGTIHALCAQILARYPERAGLRSNFHILPGPERANLLGEDFDAVFDADAEVFFKRGWGRKQDFVETAGRFFDRISEECIDVDELIDCSVPFHSALGRSYQRYRSVLMERNTLDFGLMQLMANRALRDDRVADALSAKFRHILVDEVQDVTPVQDMLLRRITGGRSIISAVGDPCQRIYGFRGADLGLMIRFPKHFPNARTVRLGVNYRSHRGIVENLNRFMSGREGPDGVGSGDQDHQPITSHQPERHPHYPSVISVLGTDPDDEARQVADLIKFLTRHKVIESHRHIAVLLFSLRGEMAGSLVEAFRCAAIPTFLKPAGTPSEPAKGFRRRDAVLITTIHQSKGLEWPIVVLASLDEPRWHPDPMGVILDHHLDRHRRRADLNTRASDVTCLHYVGMSRSRDLLVLAGNRSSPPLPVFDSVLAAAPVWPEVDQAALAEQRLGPVEDCRTPRRGRRLIIGSVGRIIGHGKPR